MMHFIPAEFGNSGLDISRDESAKRMDTYAFALIDTTSLHETLKLGIYEIYG